MMKKIALSEAKDQLSKYLHDAEKEEVVIMRHGKPAGILIGFASEDDWIDYRIENDARFLERIERARRSVREGKGVRLEDLDKRPPAPRARGGATKGRRGARG
jgi:prevent-host-death family protein